MKINWKGNVASNGRLSFHRQECGGTWEVTVFFDSHVIYHLIWLGGSKSGATRKTIKYLRELRDVLQREVAP